MDIVLWHNSVRFLMAVVLYEVQKEVPRAKLY